MAFCGPTEDISSLCLTVTKGMLGKYSLDPNKIGRLEVGTETITDKSKSVKTVLMNLFDQNNTDIEGIDTTNACYGGTAALFNTINWMESPYSQGFSSSKKLGLVVAGDIAVYAEGPARATGGCGSIAMLLSPDAPLVFEQGLRATHMEHAYDFYKPRLDSEYPAVDGALSIQCYYRALHRCYTRYKTKFQQKYGVPFDLSKADYLVFHSPFNKLVQKSFSKLLYFDYLDNPTTESEFSNFKDTPLEEGFVRKDLETLCLKLSEKLYEEKVLPSTLVSKELGNTYTASVYGSLLSLLCNKKDDLVGKRILLFSYGSGLAASMFSIVVTKSVLDIVNRVNLEERLNQRIELTPEEFAATLKKREEFLSITKNNSSVYDISKAYPQEIERLAEGTFYLASLDQNLRRVYGLKGAAL
eukprot:TRINITY_DN4517_c0_g1_i1.p1 TRINITY_DN4517_c0_g1~~TRINITY_DN4517_c0_g1_i1.p1  ORF type:complete len:479 (+),score=106.78 TRINITY_DN4517_c0_g1_i1:198-1439(+)